MIERKMKFVNPAPELWGWVKEHQAEIILAAGVVAISLLSFAAGYLTAKEQLKEPIRIENSKLETLSPKKVLSLKPQVSMLSLSLTS